MEVEAVLGILSLIFFASIFTDKIGYKFGVPALLLFLGVGMLFGPDGIGRWFGADGIGYILDLNSAQALSTVALCVILFSGGMDTKLSEIKPVATPGAVLATFGVLITAIITGALIWVIYGKWFGVVTVSIWSAMLMASTMASTDSASVFSILRTNGLQLKHNLRPLLELESGANDPMAYILTITLIGVVNSGSAEVSGLEIVQNIIVQLVMGGVLGFAFGKFVVWLLRKLNLNNVSLYPIMVLTACIAIFSITFYLQGNPYLAVYVGGLIIGNSKFTKKLQTKSFFDGLTWLSQLSMFLMLGLLVRPSQLVDTKVWVPAVVISIIMIFIARPISVLLCLMPFKQYKHRDKVLVSWIGLKGAVPIIFAILCMASGVERADIIFNVVFVCTIVSLVAQGTSLGAVAKRLKLANPQTAVPHLTKFDIDLPEEVAATASEMEVSEEMLAHGCRLMDVNIPSGNLVIMLRRGEDFFVPSGKTELHINDYLLVISEAKAEQQVQDIEEEEEQTFSRTGLKFLHHTGLFFREKWNKVTKS